jgi:hypothetical protein
VCPIVGEVGVSGNKPLVSQTSTKPARTPCRRPWARKCSASLPAGSHAPHDGQQSRHNDCNCHSLGPHPHQQHRTFADYGRKMISNVNQHQCGVVPIARAPSRIRAVSREGCHDHRRLTLRSVLKHSVLVRKEQRSQDANDSKYFHNFSHFYSLLKINPSRLG